MEFLLALFAGFALWPLWALLLFGVIILIDVGLIHNNRLGTGSVVMVLGIMALGYFGTGVNPITWAWANLWNILLFIPVWAFIGGCWSAFKWWLYSTDTARKLRKQGITKRSRDTFWFNNVYRISGWIIHWPFSMIGFVFGDMLTRLGKAVWRSFSGIYASIEKRAYHGFDD